MDDVDLRRRHRPPEANRPERIPELRALEARWVPPGLYERRDEMIFPRHDIRDAHLEIVDVVRRPRLVDQELLCAAWTESLDQVEEPTRHVRMVRDRGPCDGDCGRSGRTERELDH